MEFFQRAKTVRLKSQHNKFLYADEDEESVKQRANGASTASKWAVEFVEGKQNMIRLKSSKSWKYLSASDEPFLLGWTGKRVMQASPRLKTDACVEWEPIKEGSFLKLRARRGTFLRANGRIPPWRNSVTHDSTQTQDWLLWIVDVLEIHHGVENVGMEKKVVNDGHDPKEMMRTSSVNSNSSGGGFGSPARSVRSPTCQDSISRTSSTSSNRESPTSSYAETLASTEQVEEVSSAYLQNLKNESSKNSYAETIASSYSASPARSEQIEEVSSPYIQKLKNDSSKSNSFNNLESVIANASKTLDGRKQKSNDPNPTPEPIYSYTSSRPLALEVRMAKQTLTEAKHLDFEQILSSGRLNRVEKAMAVLTSSGNKNFTSLTPQFHALKTTHEKAVAELEEYDTYGEKKASMKEELQREVTKARELQKREEELCEVLEEARKRREEIARELQRVEDEIREAEEKQAENEAEIEEVCGVIGMRNDGVKEMEREEEGWATRKMAAEKRMTQVEEDWGMIKASLAEV